MAAYYKTYTVLIIDERANEDFIPQLSRSEAISIARKQAALHPDKNVYITACRAEDGQRLYYNKDGYGCTGKAW